MGELTPVDKLKRFLYTCTPHGAFITGNIDHHIRKHTNKPLFNWVKSSPDDFLNTLTAASEDPLLVKRLSLYYVAAEALHYLEFSGDFKLRIKDTVFRLMKDDEEFFNFIKFFTLMRAPERKKVSTSLRKMILKFYREKEPEDFTKTVTKQDSYHGWTHKDLFKLSHYKCNNTLCETVVKYVLFGSTKLQEMGNEETKATIDYLRKIHELRTTEDVPKAVGLMRELHATVDQVNSKLNKNEEIWLASLPELSTREILKCLYRFHKFNFLRAGGRFQTAVLEALQDDERTRQSNMHPLEVFIYLKFFEKGGKVADPKHLDYLKKSNAPQETIDKHTNPTEPKCIPVSKVVNKCLAASYKNLQPIKKRFMVTIDVTSKDDVCFHAKQITCLEASVAFVRYLLKMEQHVIVAVFLDKHIKTVETNRPHTILDSLKERTSNFNIPSAPMQWARKKKKTVDIFVNFMDTKWPNNVPAEVRRKSEKVSDALQKYASKMNVPDVKLVKFYLGGPGAAYTDNAKNILSIAGFSVDVPRIFEAFCRGHFC